MGTTTNVEEFTEIYTRDNKILDCFSSFETDLVIQALEERDVNVRITVENADFSNQDLSSKNLTNITFKDCNFDGANMFDADLRGSDISEVKDLSKLANMDYARVQGLKVQASQRNVDFIESLSKGIAGTPEFYSEQGKRLRPVTKFTNPRTWQPIFD